MVQHPHPFIPFGAGDLPKVSAQADPVMQGAAYLRWVQQLALDPNLVVMPAEPGAQMHLCRWLGKQMGEINATLRVHLEECQACFHPKERSPMQVLAAPLNSCYTIDAVCNPLTTPATILVDVGRVVPEDWLKLVMHEYAHAHLGLPGHGDRFREVITHLCLGLGFAPPPPALNPDLLLRQWPPCQPTDDPQAFWLQD
jgi:hypothetical protein